MKLISLLPLHLREAEDDKEASTDDASDTSENPFATADDTGKDSEEDAAAGDSEEAGQEDGEEGAEQQKALDVSFDSTKVRKYNDHAFNDTTGTVIGVSRFGLTVKLPDEKTIFVNFDDIL